MLTLLQQSPAKKSELISAVLDDEGADAYDGATGAALNKRFHRDKEALWKYLGVRIEYKKEKQGYVIVERERPFLNLPDDDIQTLAFLSDTFQPDSPQAEAVQQLVDRLADWLPHARQRQMRFAAGQLPTADLRQRDSEEIAPDVWETVLEAWQAKQELQFDYLSSQHEEAIPRQHHVQPWDLTFSPRGHWLLHGFCLFNDGPYGPWEPRDYITYRLSRIVPNSAQMLPRKLPGVRPSGKLKTAVYLLSPTITRFGVSQQQGLVGESTLTTQADGWVQVEGRTNDLFSLSRQLLYYGKNCRVTGGKELLAEMRRLVKDLNEMYLVYVFLFYGTEI